MAGSFTFNDIDMSGSSYGMFVMGQSFTSMGKVLSFEQKVIGKKGVYDFQSELSSRELQLDCIVFGTSNSDLNLNIDAINAVLDPLLGSQKLILDTQPDRYFLCRLAKEPSIAYAAFEAVMQLSFICPDAYSYAVNPTVEEIVGEPVVIDSVQKLVSPATYIDYTADVTDDLNTTYADLASFPTSGFLYVGSESKFGIMSIGMRTGTWGWGFSYMNINTSVLYATYWNGSDWTNLAIDDRTMLGGKTLAQSGNIVFVIPEDWTVKTVNGVASKYWIRFHVGAALSTGTNIAEIAILDEANSFNTIAGGNAEANPIYELTASNSSSGNVKLKNATTNKELTWNGTWTSGKVLKIDCINWIVYYDGAVSMLGVSGEFPMLKGGAVNVFTLSGMTVGATDFKITYSARYI